MSLNHLLFTLELYIHSQKASIVIFNIVVWQVLQKYGKEWIVEIKDITDFVHQQYEYVKADQLDKLLVAEERVYPVTDQATASQIRVDT